MIKRLVKQDGFTLLELLLSFTILMIVLIGFFTFFSNAASFTKKNNEDLQAINLARDVVERTKVSVHAENLIKKHITPKKETSTKTSTISSMTLSQKTIPGLLENKGIGKDVSALLTEIGINQKGIFIDPESDHFQVVWALTSPPLDTPGLMMLTVSIYHKDTALEDKGEAVTETYGYIEIRET
ncbi:type IV pilus modification PilV family protein [Priestia taiwanensis]|uniref:Prepilin-type N-terminal cleavage/methylation domain-containing protein n=1 Tax=Priestia taiwanensis TaxID=1347902 RepID=A0A917AVL3_9BACI|nr:prepilin-type N-terminal cleavage/methylation domain-containing protein [Priestia taiwanensis]MBM7363591.1 type II secretory pathway pseudopilin PulG [Priestia taiwanensis]GGE75799.1 hypothetical protein GCM10007140_26980 [Priestia taiwanensis]